MKESQHGAAHGVRIDEMIIQQVKGGCSIRPLKGKVEEGIHCSDRLAGDELPQGPDNALHADLRWGIERCLAEGSDSFGAASFQQAEDCAFAQQVVQGGGRNLGCGHRLRKQAGKQGINI